MIPTTDFEPPVDVTDCDLNYIEFNKLRQSKLKSRKHINDTLFWIGIVLIIISVISLFLQE